MAVSLSEHVENLSNGLHGKKSTDCRSGLEYMIAKNEILIFNALNVKRISK